MSCYRLQPATDTIAIFFFLKKADRKMEINEDRYGIIIYNKLSSRNISLISHFFINYIFFYMNIFKTHFNDIKIFFTKLITFVNMIYLLLLNKKLCLKKEKKTVQIQ